ncbi:MAG TPA: amidohydrolase family protein [Acidobacteriaceae bacterium]|nr:amidohydrolase family protein [Acidobacteriaceae bacterium]
MPIIDTHIHLFDTNRPEGVPWPEKTDAALYRPAFPERYAEVSQPFDVVGAIAVECSPWLSDNDWLLRAAAQSTLIVGVIGDLDPAVSGFADQLERLHANALFRGIRYGNIWGRDLGARLNDREFVKNLGLLPGLGLLFESANPDPALIRDLRRLAELVPELRIVIDHLPQAVPPQETRARRIYLDDLAALSKNPRVFVKGSETLRGYPRQAPGSLDLYRPWLDEIWDLFGEDRLLFGSDWPHSDNLAPFAQHLGIIQEYVMAKGAVAAEKFFWRNSATVYRWAPRNRIQGELISG